MGAEMINHVQQLRKAAGLDLKDVVEVFFHEVDYSVRSVWILFARTELKSCRNPMLDGCDVIFDIV